MPLDHGGHLERHSPLGLDKAFKPTSRSRDKQPAAAAAAVAAAGSLTSAPQKEMTFTSNRQHYTHYYYCETQENLHCHKGMIKE